MWVRDFETLHCYRVLGSIEPNRQGLIGVIATKNCGCMTSLTALHIAFVIGSFYHCFTKLNVAIF